MNEDELKKLEEKLAQLEKEREEYLNGWKRAKADLINYQKDEAKRFEVTAQFANLELLRDILTTLDSFNLALMTLKKSADKEVLQGIYLIYSQLETLLKKYGLEKMTAETGKVFDASREEAIGEIESDLPEGQVAEVVEAGYLYNGRVLRPARVRLSKLKK